MTQPAIPRPTPTRPQDAHLTAPRHDEIDSSEPQRGSVIDPAQMPKAQIDALEAALPEHFSCAIGLAGVMVDPVYDRRYLGTKNVDGKTRRVPVQIYERANIAFWVNKNHDSPFSRKRTAMYHMRAHDELRAEIERNPVAHFIAMRDAEIEGRPDAPTGDASWHTLAFYGESVGHAIYDPAANMTKAVAGQLNKTLGAPAVAAYQAVAAATAPAVVAARALFYAALRTSPILSGAIVGVLLAKMPGDRTGAVAVLLAVAWVYCTPGRPNRHPA